MRRLRLNGKEAQAVHLMTYRWHRLLLDAGQWADWTLRRLTDPVQVGSATAWVEMLKAAQRGWSDCCSASREAGQSAAGALAHAVAPRSREDSAEDTQGAAKASASLCRFVQRMVLRSSKRKS